MNPNKLHFKMMTFSFKLRDFFSPPRNILKEVGIKPGDHVLDYGCGPGSYIIPTAELVGKSGKIYALDVNPLAAQAVRKISSKKGLTNVETITSECKTGLPSESIDVVLLYDTFHALSDPNSVLKELHRVLKPDGILSLSDHHMTEGEIISKITRSGLFKLSKKGGKVYNFQKRSSEK
ncbi:MAG: class I SAM-dependent methyltransferase [Candidatus Freyarchaeota archaeon]